MFGRKLTNIIDIPSAQDQNTDSTLYLPKKKFGKLEKIIIIVKNLITTFFLKSVFEKHKFILLNTTIENLIRVPPPSFQ